MPNWGWTFSIFRLIFFYWNCWWTKHGTPVEMAKTASNIIYTITFTRIWFWIMQYLNIWRPYVPSRFRMFPFHWTNHENNGLSSKKWSDHSWPSLFISCVIEHNQKYKTEIPLHNIQPTLITLAKHNITITTTLSPIVWWWTKVVHLVGILGPQILEQILHEQIVPDMRTFLMAKCLHLWKLWNPSKRWIVQITTNNTCLVKH